MRISVLRTFFRHGYCLALLLVCSSQGFSQPRLDSLGSLLGQATSDTDRVKLLWRMSYEESVSQPDSALRLSFKAISLARKVRYLEGESKALGIMANTFMHMGNYPRALELQLEKLQLEEKRGIPQNLASVTMNIGIVYALQEEYGTALTYYRAADSIIRLHQVAELQYNIALNIGDTYDHLDKNDSAFRYFSHSLALAKAASDPELIGTSLTGLGHVYFREHQYPEALDDYRRAIALLREAGNDEVLCEATLGLAGVFRATENRDSARYYAGYSMMVAGQNFQARELEAATFLARLYREWNKPDSAFAYIDRVAALNGELNSKSNIRKLQILSTNESLRQLELEEERKAAKKERNAQLQLLLIAVFIPAFFIFTLFVSRLSLGVRFLRLMGVLSLLFLFEFITLLVHPTIAELTHYTPVYELLILTAIAAFIIPLHHRMEHWMIHKLIHQREQHELRMKVEPQQAKKAPASAGGKKVKP